MLRIFRHYIPKTLILLGIAELLILFSSIYLGASFHLGVDPHKAYAAIGGANMPLWVQALVFAGAIGLGMMSMGLYHRDQHTAPAGVLLRLLLSFLCGFVLMGAVYLVVPELMIGGIIIATALACSFVGIATCRLICIPYQEADHAPRVLVLGTGSRAKQIANILRSECRIGVNILGFINLGNDERLIPAPRTIELGQRSLRELVDEMDADEIVVAIDDRRRGLPIDDILECKMYGVSIIEAADFYERQLGKIRLDTLHPSNVIFADGFTQAVITDTEKRVLDVIASTLLVVCTLPILALTTIAIFLESGRSILYRQERVGRRGAPFTLYKFRSMHHDAEKDGAVWARQEDDRVTVVGRFIRKARIDELPQLFNVLKGDMSFVGPRPERPEFVEQLSAAIPYYDLRHHVKPGITGWAQISYPYCASLNDSREKLQYDLYYLKNYSVFLDINILLQTIQVILWGKGAR